MFRRLFVRLKEKTALPGRESGRNHMIELTRMNGTTYTVNADLIEMVEETPDTVITLTTGKKLIVKESRQDVRNLVILYKKEIISDRI